MPALGIRPSHPPPWRRQDGAFSPGLGRPGALSERYLWCATG